MTAKSFISLSGKDLLNWGRIIESGLRGTHLLFSNEMIRDAFAGHKTEELLREKICRENLRQTLISLARASSFHEKRWIIENLDAQTRALLVHLYFGLLDQLWQRGQHRAEVLN